MRYILNNSGYVEEISFTHGIECNNKICIEYTGSVPEGYENLAEWSELANINAYKVVDGELIYDSAEDTRLQDLWDNQKKVNEESLEVYSTEEKIIGTWVDGKPLYRKSVYVVVPNDTPHGITNAVFVSIRGFYKSNTSSNTFPIPSARVAYPQYQCGIYVDGTTIKFDHGEGTFGTGYITLEYTKTTD